MLPRMGGGGGKTSQLSSLLHARAARARSEENSAVVHTLTGLWTSAAEGWEPFPLGGACRCRGGGGANM